MSYEGEAAKGIDRLGPRLRCDRCLHEQRLRAEQTATYLQSGWPEHCGETMRLVTAKEREAEGVASDD